MNAYSEAVAKKRVPELIDRVLRGESVIMTRHGEPVAVLRPITRPSRKISAAALDWLAARRVGTKRPHEDADALVSRMRGGWEC